MSAGKDSEVAVPLVWLLLGAVAMVLLALLLWSVQRGRDTHLTIGEIGDLRGALPSLAGATHSALLGGNRVELLQNGAGFFPALFDAVAQARHSVHLESYVWWRGEVCRRLAELLARKAREGVEVRVLLDAVGSKRMDPRLLATMRDAGCQVARYRPFRLSNLGRINSRDHRKLLVVDGRLGLVFGHGIAEQWEGDAEDPGHWRDTAARVAGPVVRVLQSAFSENWVEETGEVLAGEAYYPSLAPAGEAAAHVTYHYQHGSVSSVELLYRLAFAAAGERLWIQNPYLAPDPPVVAALVAAARRGVDVRIMLPGEVTDSQAVRHAGHRLYERLLAGGVRIYEYTRTLNHQKVMVVDGLWSHIGSTNLDDRSFESNDELSLGIVDEGIAAQLEQAFLDDLRHCVEIDLESWRRRPRRHRLQDRAAYLFNEWL